MKVEFEPSYSTSAMLIDDLYRGVEKMVPQLLRSQSSLDEYLASGKVQPVPGLDHHYIMKHNSQAIRALFRYQDGVVTMIKIEST